MTRKKNVSVDVNELTGAEKERNTARFSLIPPDVMWELAEHYGYGSEKYSDRNWEKGYNYSWSYDALQRHLQSWWEGEDLDEDSKNSHLIAAAWHCFALRWFQLHEKGFDDRPGTFDSA